MSQWRESVLFLNLKVAYRRPERSAEVSDKAVCYICSIVTKSALCRNILAKLTNKAFNENSLLCSLVVSVGLLERQTRQI